MSYIGNEPIVSATRTITETTATAGQTVFVANGGYTVGFIDVFVNGAQLQTSDFTATNGTSITLNSAAFTGDDIRLVAWGTFSTSTSAPLNGVGTSGTWPISVTGSAVSLATTNWTVSETAGVLYFAHGGTNKAKLDSSGNLTVVGNVTAYGTV